MRRIWHRLFAAAAAAVVLAGTAAAQTPAPPVAAPVAAPAAQPVAPLPAVAQPAPGPVVPSVPATVAPLAPGQGAVVVPGNGGVYAPNGTYNGGYFMSGPGTPTRLGSGPNGCGSCAQDAAFVFGSCRSFFAPCGGVSNGHGHGGRGHHGNGCGGHGGNGCGNGHGGGLGFLLRGGCINPVGGTGPAQGFNPCCYDSYLNH
jgi:hypothetical protein